MPTIYSGYLAAGIPRVLKGTRQLDPAKSLRLRNHSHLFSWGSVNAGSAQLALAILLEETESREADGAYQAFKREVIATLPMEGAWELSSEKISEWLAAWRAKSEAPTADIPRQPA